MKHQLTESHKHNFEIHNNVLFSQSISLSLNMILVDQVTFRNPLQG